MKHKIAVIHSMSTEMMLLSKALSCLSGYGVVLNRNVYEWMSMFQIEESQMNRFGNQFLILASSFLHRITSEFYCSDFVSTGAVFTDVLSLQLKIDKKSIVCESPEDARMIKILLEMTGRYAASHYDAVIHVCTADSKSFDEYSIGFYKKYNMAYLLYDGADQMKDIVEHIVREVEIPKVQSVDRALYEAIRAVTFKN